MTTRAAIRHATADDVDAVRALYRAAFPGAEGERVGALAAALLGADRARWSWLSAAGGSVLGHLAFSALGREDAADWRGAILAPLAVAPGHQRGGIGAALVRAAIAQLRAEGVEQLFVYGDPAYYGRFGFAAAGAERFVPPHPLQYPHGWQWRAPSGVVAPAAPVAIRCVPALDDPGLW